MSKNKMKIKLVLLIALIMSIVALCAGFIWLGVGIYGARFYVFSCISSFLSFIIVRTLLSSMFVAIDELDKAVKASSVQAATA